VSAGLDVIYADMGWDLALRYARRQDCPACHARAGRPCTRPQRGGDPADLTGTVHSSRYAFSATCDEHNVLPGEPCSAGTVVCEQRVADVAQLAGKSPALTGRIPA
jgi:hypothetical protein